MQKKNRYKGHFFYLITFLITLNASSQTIHNIQNLKDNSKCLKISSFFEFPKELQETSALIYTHQYFWTINDGGNAPILYALYNPFVDSSLVHSKKDVIALRIELPVSNVDYEALASDSEYLYVGDFGNNLGSRKDLKIYVFKVSELLDNNVKFIDTLQFEFEDQKEFEPRRLHTFDCESMITSGENLYLFTKNWSNMKTNVYQVSKKIKYQKAIKSATMNPNFFVTDACEFKGTLFLCGYNYLGNQFIYQSNWKKGETVKIDLKPAQIEGITVFRESTTGELVCYLTSEKRKSQPAGIFKMIF